MEVQNDHSAAGLVTGKPLSEQSNEATNPDLIKNYLPYTFIQDKPGGVDIINIERLGEQLDDMKPVFLYFPELGKVDLKALSLSISSGITAEINVALNILLIISSDPNVQVPFDQCMLLLDSLSLLGKNIIETLAAPNSDYRLDISKESNIEAMSHKSRIDKVFEKYSKGFGDSEYTVQVDSFTSQIVVNPAYTGDTQPVSNVITIEGEIYDSPAATIANDGTATELSNNNGVEEYSNLMSDSFHQFKIPSYLNMLHECRAQADDIDFNIYKKSYLDRQVVLIEELSTISLIFRNLSFVGNNNLVLATSGKYLDFIFTLIYATIAKPDIFLFARKRLSFMKDSLTIFSNIIHAVDVRSDMEMWLILSLAFSFSSSLNEYEKELRFTTSKLEPVIDKYHAHSVDILSKVICGSFANKNKFSNLLTGKGSDRNVLQMIKTNFGDDCFESGSLLKSTFTLFISVLPVITIYQGIERFNEMFQTCLESLLGCLTLTEILENAATFKSNVALDTLISPERLGMILQHLSFVYAAIYVNVKDDSSDIHALISARCAELANNLIECAINYAIANETVDEDLTKLRGISQLLGNMENVIGMLMTVKMPQQISEQVVKTLNISNKLGRLLRI